MYGEGLVAEMATAALPRYWPMPLLTPMCQTLAACASLLGLEPCEQHVRAAPNMQCQQIIMCPRKMTCDAGKSACDAMQ